MGVRAAAPTVLVGLRQRFSRMVNSPKNPTYSPLGLFSLRYDLNNTTSNGHTHNAQILGGELLWKEFSVAEVRSKISCGDRPYMPKGKVEFGVTVETWEMLTKCWEVEAEERVTISDVVNFLRYT